MCYSCHTQTHAYTTMKTIKSIKCFPSSKSLCSSFDISQMVPEALSSFAQLRQVGAWLKWHVSNARGLHAATLECDMHEQRRARELPGNICESLLLRKYFEDCKASNEFYRFFGRACVCLFTLHKRILICMHVYACTT